MAPYKHLTDSQTVVINIFLMFCVYMYVGSDVTVVGYGTQLQTIRKACTIAKEELGVQCEIIDLRTLLPWDIATVAKVSL